MQVDELYGSRHSASTNKRDLLRAAALKFAQENRFKGVIFGDISGHLSSLGNYSRSSPLPIFYPLLALEEEDLTDLSRLGGLERRELLSESGSEEESHASAAEMRSVLDGLPVPAVREVQL
jgi:adenylyl- and sulfurtransferase ThiI